MGPIDMVQRYDICLHTVGIGAGVTLCTDCQWLLRHNDTLQQCANGV